jgi:hypothetical protein
MVLDLKLKRMAYQRYSGKGKEDLYFILIRTEAKIRKYDQNNEFMAKNKGVLPEPKLSGVLY